MAGAGARLGPRPGPGAVVLGAVVFGAVVFGAVLLGATVLAACANGADPEAIVTAEVDVDPPVGSDIAVLDGSVWLPASDDFAGPEPEEPRHAVVQIDADSASVESVIDMPHQMVAIEAEPGRVWVTGSDVDFDTGDLAGSLVRIDPTTGDIAATLDLGESTPSDVVVGHGSVWVSDSTGDRVFRVDRATEEIVAEVSIEGGPTSLAVTDDAVWVTKPRTGQVRAIDPVTDAPLPVVGTGQLPSVLDAGGAGLWVADYAENRLARIEPDRGEVARSIEFPTAPSRFDVSDDLVAVVESEGEELSIVRGPDGSRDPILSGRVLVAIAIDGSDLWAVDHGANQVIRLQVPET